MPINVRIEAEVADSATSRANQMVCLRLSDALQLSWAVPIGHDVERYGDGRQQPTAEERLEQLHKVIWTISKALEENPERLSTCLHNQRPKFE